MNRELCRKRDLVVIFNLRNSLQVFARHDDQRRCSFDNFPSTFEVDFISEEITYIILLYLNKL